MTKMTQMLIELFDSLAGSVFPVLVETSLKGAMLLLAAAGAALVLRRSSAANRHLVWVAALVGLALLPLAGSVAPEWRALPGAVRSWTSPASTPAPAMPDHAGPVVAVVDEGSARTAESLAGDSPGETTQSLSVVGDAAASGARGEASRALSPGAASAGAWSALFAVWLAGALALGIRLVTGVLRLRDLSRSARPVTGDPLASRVLEASRELGLNRPVTALISNRTKMPMTWGLWRPTVLLPEGAAGWPGARLRHVLLHELAHVKRMDQPVQLLAGVVRAVHWFNPLVWLAVARIKVERERACDDRVIQAGCPASEYARDLLSVARGLQGPKRPLAAAAAVPMARRSGLPERVEAILDPRVPRRAPGPVAGIVTAGIVALVLVPLAALAPTASAEAGEVTGTPEGEREAPGSLAAPAPASEFSSWPPPAAQSAEHCIVRKGGSHSVSVNADERRWDIRWSVGDCSTEVELRGDVEFLADESGVARMGPRSRLEIEEEYEGTTRRIRMEPGSGGEPVIEYWVNGDRRDFDAGGRAWLASFLPEMFRYTTIDSERRARRILDNDGVSGLLREIDRMESDHVAARYFQHLLTMAELRPDQVVNVLDLVARRLDSDHYRAEILTAVAQGQGLEPAYRSAYLAAARELDSDHYKHRVLDQLLDRRDLEPETLSAVLDASRDVESDHYLSRILERVAAAGPIPREGRSSFLRAMESLESDHYAARVVQAFLARGSLATGELEQVMELVDGIDSDHYRGRVLETVLDRVELDDGELARLIDSASRMGSDHQAGRVLMSVARRYRLQGRVREAFLEAADGLGSRHTRDRVLAALARGA